jgi:hypothetical protein
MEFKKSAVDLTDLAIGIVVLGIVAAIGSTILLGVRDTTVTDSDVITVTNENVGNLTTAKTLDNVFVKALTSCINGQDSAVITSNTTLTVDTSGVGTITGAGTATSMIANCSYTYYDIANNPAYDTASSAAIGLGEYGNWFDIIVIVGVAAVILSLIFMAFGKGNLAGGY